MSRLLALRLLALRLLALRLLALRLLALRLLALRLLALLSVPVLTASVSPAHADPSKPAQVRPAQVRPAEPSAPAPAGERDVEAVSGELARAIDGLANDLLRLRALTEGRGRGTLGRPLFTRLAESAKAHADRRTGAAVRSSYTCATHAPIGTSACRLPEPGPAPREPAGVPCQRCDENARDRAWQSHLGKQLGASALANLRQIQRAMGRHAGFAELTLVITRRLRALSDGDGARALRWELRHLLEANTEAARERALEQSLQAVIDALELGITPDDLQTEGGLAASVKLAGALVQASGSSWQRALSDWSRCLQSAVAARKIAKGSEQEGEGCSEAQAGEPSASESRTPQNGAREDRAELDAYFAWRTRRDAYQICLESSASPSVTVAQEQSTPCAPGRALELTPLPPAQ